MVNKLALFVTHNIFLTNNQLDELIDKNSLEITGVSVPVWVNASNGKTTEPALEYFCKYEIINDLDKQESIEIIDKKGYRIYLPQSDWEPIKDSLDLSNSSEEERKSYEKKMNKWWEKNPEPQSLKTLKKSKYFRTQIKKLDEEFDKLSYKVDVQHIIEIKTMESLIESLG
jgi:hypothetical protein